MPTGVYPRKPRSDKPKAASGGKESSSAKKVPELGRRRRTRPGVLAPASVVQEAAKGATPWQQRFGQSVDMAVAEPLHVWLRVTAEARQCTPEQLLQEAIIDFIRGSSQ